MIKSALSLGRTLLIRPSSFRLCSSTPSEIPPASSEDEPVILEKNPYTKEPRKCLLCTTGVELDYKNARLLQKFVSTFSGRVYDRHITGLCDDQQKKLVEAIAVGFFFNLLFFEINR
uniref:28S ribosomal protein S18c, mitochondrial n=1 Tax=Caenorhabditis japonica TaxID=281687 RepID=A0A8R1HJ67_CAEJA